MRLIENARNRASRITEICVTLNSSLYFQQLERVNQELIKDGVDLRKTRILHDNARPHASTMTKKNQGARLDNVTARAIQHFLSAI